ncbi:MAG: hypothetical protein J6Y60_12570 [Treponema sp.]|nr:hypothetical protein [Treponema sp.]
MTVPAGITLGITIATFILGIIYKLIDLSVKYGRFSRQMEDNERRDQEERDKAAKKFDELFNSRNNHETSLARLDTTIINIDAKLEKIDGKLDKLMEGK